MTTATYYSAALVVDGDATGLVTIDDTSLLVAGARVVLIDKNSEPAQYKVQEVVSLTEFLVCNIDDTPADLSSYTVAKASRVTQFYQELDESFTQSYVLKSGDSMTGPLAVDGGITAATVGVIFPDESLQITAVPDPSTGAGLGVFSDGTKYILRAIRESDIVKVFSINGLSVDAGTLEVGATLTNPSFTASYNRTPTSASIVDNQGGAAKNVSSTPTAFGLTATYTKTANNSSVGFTLTAADGPESATRSTSVAWRPRVYYGAGAAGINTEAGIKALSNSGLAGGRGTTLTITAGAGLYIYYAFPASYGTPTFVVGGFEGGFELVSGNVSVTNGFGVTQAYQIWKSVQPSLGATTVVVS